MRTRRHRPGSLLAFLDVMACGLGAAVLLLLVVKHHGGAAVEPERETPAASAGVRTLAALREEADALADRIEKAERESGRREERERQARAAGEARFAGLEREIAKERARNAALRADVESTAPLRAGDVLETGPGGEENYLLGLRVEGRRIAILLDRSASMTDERLVDVVARKVRTDSEKRKGPKWRRALRAVRWLLLRAPEGAQVAVVAFGSEARTLHGGAWADGRNGAALRGVFAELERLVPTGATNLEAGLRELERLSPPASDIYVVTDGLPTRSVSSPGPSSPCSGGARGKVTGACRKTLFYTSLRKSAPAPGRKVSVVLLPLEGDPEAAPAYWNWTAQAGGLLMTPARGWP